MSQSNQFDRLEQFVRKLLTQYEQLVDKNAHLQRLLQQRENEITELKEKIDSADSERGDISNRIKNLIEQIEEWQAGVVEPTEDEEELESVTHEEEASSEPEENTSKNDEEKEEEKDDENRDGGAQRNQRNLFHVGPDQG